MILEGLVTTLNPDGSPHVAPMGPRVPPDFSHLTLRPFPTSHTCQNLLRHRQGVFHVTDDALLMAQAAIGQIIQLPELRRAEHINGFVLVDCCRYYEFIVRSIDELGERVSLEAEVVYSGRAKDFYGFNRAKHAIVEAAILATRLHFLPLPEVAAEFNKLRAIVGKTGGPAELEAMNLLDKRLREAEAGR
jgi:hypothetical protein